MEQSRQDMDPNDLLVFARVAELGSFSRAAERLGLPKSTVSRRIAILEARVGERLLVRSTRRQTLTDLGAALLEHARQIASEVDAAIALRDHRQSAPSGRLRVSLPGDVANLVLADTLAAFVALHPAIALELDVSPRRVDLLGEGFDAAVRIGVLPDDVQLVARRLTAFTHALYAAPAYLAQRGEPGAPQDLLDHDAVRLLGSDGEPMAWTLTRGDQRWQAVPPGRAAANSPELLIRLACAGAGIAAVPAFFAHPFTLRGELRRVLPEWSLPPATVWVVFPGRKLMPAKTRVFVEMLQSALSRPDLRI